MNDKTDKNTLNEKLTKLLDGVSEKDIPILRTLLATTYNEINTPIDHYKNLTYAITKSIFTHFTIGELVGVQPMHKPVDIGHLLQLSNSNNEITLCSTDKTIAAKSCKLSTSASIEFIEDANTFGTSQVCSYDNILVSSIMSEITTMIINNLKNISEGSIKISLKDDNIERLISTIHVESNNIGRLTRRGRANWLITTAPIISLFKSLPNNVYTGYNDTIDDNVYTGYNDTIDDNIPLNRNGTLLTHIAVYETNSDIINNEILLGYKGQVESDAGYIFCPYQIPTRLLICMNEQFQPIIQMVIRFDELFNNMENGVDGITKASNYYQRIEIDM